jgi:CspA family cold shock protein
VPTNKKKQKIKMKTGTVKFFNEDKGFGFITEENGKDTFVHITGLNDTIKTDDSVTFEVTDGKKGPTAINVTLN